MKSPASNFSRLMVLAALVLTACGSSAQAPTTAPTAQASQGPGATPASAATTAATGQQKTLRFVWLGDLTPLWHPAGYSTFGQSVIFSLIFNNLVKLDDDLKTVIPDLAAR